MICYRITNLASGKAYIGLTTESLAKRWARHVQFVKRGIGYAIHDAMRAHGVETFECMEFASPIPRTSEALAQLEIILIAQEGSVSPGGYNLTTGGEGVGGCAETGQKISAAMRGRKFTPEHREKLAAAKRGIKRGPPSAEVIERISAKQRGIPRNKHTPETKEKCRLAGIKGSVMRRASRYESERIEA